MLQDNGRAVIAIIVEDGRRSKTEVPAKPVEFRDARAAYGRKSRPESPFRESGPEPTSIKGLSRQDKSQCDAPDKQRGCYTAHGGSPRGLPCHNG